MTAGELLNHFNMKTSSMGLPRVLEGVALDYLNDAYRLFVAGIDGVPDEEEIALEIGETEIVLPPYVLKVRSAIRADGRFIKIVNRLDTETTTAVVDSGLGAIKYFMLGAKQGVMRVVESPIAAETVLLDVDRLPRALLTATSALSDIAELRQLGLADKMVAHAMMLNPDPKIRSQADGFELRFTAGIIGARKEKSRVKSKPARLMAYGGI